MNPDTSKSIIELLQPTLVFLAPYAVKCVITILITFGLYRWYERMTKKELPRELKAFVPIIIAIVAQFIYPERFIRDPSKVHAFTTATKAMIERIRYNRTIEFILKNLGIGIAVGTIATSFYDVIIKFVFRFIGSKTPEKKNDKRDK